MGRLKDIWFRVRALLGSRRMDRELSEEMRFHLDMEAAELVRGGMDPAEARRRALIALGGIDRYREEARDARGTRSVEDLFQDMRFGVRNLRKSPTFTGVVLLVLSLGIGASTAIFSVVDGILFQPLPYPESEDILGLFSTDPDDQRGTLSGADFLDLKDQTQAFRHVAGHNVKNFSLVQESGPQRLRGTSVTSEYFQVFGVDAFLGRTLSPSIDVPGGPRVVVLSHSLWQSAFGGNLGIIGRNVDLNDRGYEIVGVAPPTFDYPGVSLWTSSDFAVPDPPFEDGTDPSLDRGAEYIHVVAKLRPDVRMEEAASELDVLASRLRQDYPDSHEDEGILAVPLQEVMTEEIRPTLHVLLAAVGILLLIACGNVANLLLARAARREQEMAVRRALGAGRRRLVAQLLAESTLLAAVGGIAGALFAVWGTRGLLALAPEGIPRIAEVGADLRFVGFAAALSLTVGLGTGLLASLRASQHREGGGTLLSGSRQVGSRGRSRARRFLVIGEVAFSLVLLVGAGLMVRTLAALNRVDPGFRPEHTVAAHLSLPEERYSTDEEIWAFVQSVEERTRSRPGVESVGTILSLPIRSGLSGRFYFSIEGRPPDDNNQTIAGYQITTPEYFETLGIPLRSGRLFTAFDGPDDPRVVVVNQAMANRFWPGREALGQRVTWDDPEEEGVEWSTVVGVVGNSLQGGLDRDPRPEIFRLYSQAPLPYLTLVVNGGGETGLLAEALRGSVLEVDPRVPLYGMATMEELLSDSLGPRRFAMTLLGAFAGIALVLTAAGLFGVLRYGVSQRTKEIGIRVALGAPAKGIVGDVLGEGILLTVLGLGIGIGLAVPAGRMMGELVFQVDPVDPTTFLVGGALLSIVALAACAPPAFRASRTDPLDALREE